MAPIATRPVTTLPQGTAFGRYVRAQVFAESSDRTSAVEMAKHWLDTPHVLEAMQAEFSGSPAMATKAVSNFGTIAEPSWAAPLSAYGLSQEALLLERGQSVLGALLGRMRRVPFRVSIPREVGSGMGGAWVGEGAPTPVSQGMLDTLNQNIHKAAAIAVLSSELLKVGTPAADQTIAKMVTASSGAYLDAQFLTASVTASGSLRPAAITNGATEITSTGGTAAQIIADLAALIQAITTAGASLVWIMRPKTAYTIAARLAGAGFQTDVPSSLLGIPLILSANSPRQITLVDAAEVIYSDTEEIGIDVSRQASVEMDGAPTSPATASTVLVSLWQLNLVGVRVQRWATWQRAHEGSVAWMTTSY